MPREKAALEADVAQRFLALLSETSREVYTIDEATTEPADFSLLDSSSNRIQVQIAEIVDKHRLQHRRVRESYGRAVWRSLGDSLRSFYGVKVKVHDLGIGDLPPIHEKAAKTVLDELQSEFLSLIRLVDILPVNSPDTLKGLKTQFRLSSVSLTLQVALLRYYSDVPAEMGHWHWGGPPPEPDGGQCAIEVLTKKMKHYSAIDQEFWLLLYSLDYYCDKQPLFDFLSSNTHPFDRVFMFHPAGQEYIELYPQNTAALQDSGRVLIRLIAQDFEIGWGNDPRWLPLVCPPRHQVR